MSKHCWEYSVGRTQAKEAKRLEGLADLRSAYDKEKAIQDLLNI